MKPYNDGWGHTIGWETVYHYNWPIRNVIHGIVYPTLANKCTSLDMWVEFSPTYKNSRQLESGTMSFPYNNDNIA